MAARHAVTAVGILIMQDIIAVVFLAISSGKAPNLWAPVLIAGIFLIRPLLLRFMSRCGHGELMMLFSILMPAAGYGSFELVGLKGDLGALAHAIYARWSELLKRFQTAERLPDEMTLDTEGARIAVIGMGGIGTAAYNEMRRRYGDVVVGIDFCKESVDAHHKLGRRVALGDASDSDFWSRADPSTDNIGLVMLTLPDPRASAFAISQLKARGYEGQITASVRY